MSPLHQSRHTSDPLHSNPQSPPYSSRLSVVLRLSTCSSSSSSLTLRPIIPRAREKPLDSPAGPRGFLKGALTGSEPNPSGEVPLTLPLREEWSPRPEGRGGTGGMSPKGELKKVLNPPEPVPVRRPCTAPIETYSRPLSRRLPEER